MVTTTCAFAPTPGAHRSSLIKAAGPADHQFLISESLADVCHRFDGRSFRASISARSTHSGKGDFLF
jgi:hypothetical protein